MHLCRVPGRLSEGTISLRLYRFADAPRLSRLISDDGLMQLEGSTWSRTVRRAVAWRRCKNGFQLVYTLLRDSEIIGMAGFYNLVCGESTELAILIGPESERRQGYGSAAFRLLSQVAAERLRVNRLTVRIAHDNPEGRAFWEGVGFCATEKGGGKLFFQKDLTQPVNCISTGTGPMKHP
jgi:RimJ/RimL family protein N-acetyltransferase